MELYEPVYPKLIMKQISEPRQFEWLSSFMREPFRRPKELIIKRGLVSVEMCPYLIDIWAGLVVLKVPLTCIQGNINILSYLRSSPTLRHLAISQSHFVSEFCEPTLTETLDPFDLPALESLDLIGAWLHDDFRVILSAFPFISKLCVECISGTEGRLIDLVVERNKNWETLMFKWDRDRKNGTESEMIMKSVKLAVKDKGLQVKNVYIDSSSPDILIYLWQWGETLSFDKDGNPCFIVKSVRKWVT
jgi:hypothetical protein